jgi:hypothetical protein
MISEDQRTRTARLHVDPAKQVEFDQQLREKITKEAGPACLYFGWDMFDSPAC